MKLHFKRYPFVSDGLGLETSASVIDGYIYMNEKFANRSLVVNFWLNASPYISHIF